MSDKHSLSEIESVTPSGTFYQQWLRSLTLLPISKLAMSGIAKANLKPHTTNPFRPGLDTNKPE